MLHIKSTLTFNEYRDALRFGTAMRLRRQTIAFVAVVAFEVVYYILGKSLGVVPYISVINALAIAYMLIFLYGVSKRERAAADYVHRKDTLIGRAVEYTFTDTDVTVFVPDTDAKSGEEEADAPGDSAAEGPAESEPAPGQRSTYTLASLHCVFEMPESFMLCPTISQMFIIGKTALPAEDADALRDFLSAHMGDRFVSNPDGKMSRADLLAAQKRFFA